MGMLNEFKEFMRVYNQKMIQDRNMGLEAEIADEINRIYHQGLDLHMKSIAEKVNEKHAKGERQSRSGREDEHDEQEGKRQRMNRTRTNKRSVPMQPGAQRSD